MLFVAFRLLLVLRAATELNPFYEIHWLTLSHFVPHHRVGL